MNIDKDTVLFGQEDMDFVREFGVDRAADMVLEHHKYYSVPFIYDAKQLAAFLEVSDNELLNMLVGTSAYYRKSLIPKRSGGYREISEPTGELAFVQKIILKRILYKERASSFSTAYFPGSKLAYNALPHVGKKRILKTDVTDFFGSVTFNMVYWAAFDEPLYPEWIGKALTTLCCLDGKLPQGACTSPALSNLVMRGFDSRIGLWCYDNGLKYTRYCDDITISGDRPLYPAFCKVRDTLTEFGFQINEKKTRFITNASRQTVTGLVVNDKVAVPSDYKRALRQELYYILKFGMYNVIEHMNLKEYKRYGGMTEYYNNLMGRINYVLSVEPMNEYFHKAKEELREQRTSWIYKEP